MRRAWLVVLASCYAQDNTFIDGKDGKDGALIRGKFSTRTTCAANAGGELRCFSACNPMVYALKPDLTLARRIPFEGAACNGVVDDAGAVHIGDGPMAAAHGVVAIGTARGVEVTSPVAADAQRAATEPRAWTAEVGAVHAVGVAEDGAVLAATADALIAFDPGGHERWRRPRHVEALSVGPGGKLAVAGTGVALLAPTGEAIWKRPEISGSSVATDGRDLFVASKHTVMRVGAAGIAWSRLGATTGCRIAARIVGLAPASLLIELAETACEDTRDRQRITYGDDAIDTDSAGTLLARVAR